MMKLQYDNKIIKYNAAKSIIYNPYNNKYLVGIHYIGPPFYSLLGGRKDVGENHLQTLKREFFEETSGALEIITKNNQYYLVDHNKFYDLYDPKIIYEKEPYDVIFYIFTLKDKVPDNFSVEINKKILMNQDLVFNRLAKSLNVKPWILRIIFDKKQSDINNFIFTVIYTFVNNNNNVLQILKEIEESLVYLENNGIDFISLDKLNHHLLEKNILKYISI